MAGKEWPTNIISLERVTVRGLHYVKVVFEVNRGEFDSPFLLPINVPAEVDDAAIVPFARSFLAHSLRRLAEQTAGWVLTEEQVQALRPEKSNQ